MIVKQFTESVRRFFEARNEAWITLDTDDLMHVSGLTQDSRVMKAIRKTLFRKRRAYDQQNKKLARVHTKVKVYPSQTSDWGNSNEQRIFVDEFLHFVYRDRQNFAVELRVIHHEQTWTYTKDEWILVNARESNERDKVALESFGDKLSTNYLEGPQYPRGRDSQNRTYDRVAAIRYADLWWNGFNPKYKVFTKDDCTNFISQCVYAGQLPMVGGQNSESGWWYKFNQSSKAAHPWSYSWSTSNALSIYLLSKVGAIRVKTAAELKMGDLIFYDWAGSGSYHHTTIVTDFDDDGEPLVNAHTDASAKRPWLYQDSRAWTPNTKYQFLHMPDIL
jgi:Putative amidase domain